MQSHKNSSLKQAGATPSKGVTGGATTLQMDKPPQFTKDGKKWLIVSLISQDRQIILRKEFF